MKNSPNKSLICVHFNGHEVSFNSITQINISVLWKSWQAESSTVITRSTIVRYCINNCRNWSRISARPEDYIPNLALHVCDKIDCVITAPHCIKNFTRGGMDQIVQSTYIFHFNWNISTKLYEYGIVVTNDQLFTNTFNSLLFVHYYENRWISNIKYSYCSPPTTNKYTRKVTVQHILDFGKQYQTIKLY